MSQQINDNFDLDAPKPLIKSYMKEVEGVPTPYTSTAEVLSMNTQRFPGQTFLISDEGTFNEYWFYGGVTDNDLKLKVDLSAVTISPDTLASMLSTLMNSINPKCLDTQGSWNSKDFVAKFQTIIDKMCYVAPIPPTVSSGGNKSINLPMSTVTLNGSASDSDGTITSTVWSQISGPNTATIATPNNVSTVINNLIEGSYVFRLTATDNSNLTAYSNATVTVNYINPTANAGSNKSIQLPTNNTSVTGTATAGSNNSLSYAWTQVSGPSSATFGTPTLLTTTVNNLNSAGVYTMRLTVTDANSRTGTSTMTITVAAALVFDTIFTFATQASVSDSPSGITATVSATNSTLKFECNKITNRLGTPATMNINVNSSLVMIIDYLTDYTGQPFRFTDANGVAHSGTFTNGTVNF